MAPNDGRCHLNSSGFYDWSTMQDYPSLGHINHIAKEYGVSIIWAVSSSQISLYQQLSSFMTSTVAGEISSDSGNIVELIEEMYNKIMTTIRVEDKSSESIQIYYTTSCGKKRNKRKRRCKNVPLGTQVDFTAHITMKKCKSSRIEIFPVGLDTKMTIEVEPICECSCSSPSVKREPSELCNQRGYNLCGDCECFSGWGKFCQCESSSVNVTIPEESCRYELHMIHIHS